MSRSSKAFLWCLPALLILTHDVLFFFSWGNPFAFSEIGWFLQTYLPDLHDGLVRAVGEEYYGNFLKPLFELKSFYFFAAIGAVACLWQFCLTRLEQPQHNIVSIPHPRKLKAGRSKV